MYKFLMYMYQLYVCMYMYMYQHVHVCVYPAIALFSCRHYSCVIIPSGLLDCLQCITPFIMGLHKSLLEEIDEEVAPVIIMILINPIIHVRLYYVHVYLSIAS